MNKMKDMIFYDKLLNNNVQLYPDKLALECDSYTYTYAELDDVVKKMASLFTDNGIGKGTKVMLLHANPCKYSIIMLAIIRVGAIPMPIYSKMGIGKLEEMIVSFEPNYLIKADDNEYIRLEDCDFLNRVDNWGILNILEFKLKVYTLFRAIDYSLDKVKLILFTSGTTSTPKAIMLSMDNIMANICSICDYLQPDSTDNMLLIKDLSHSSSITSELFIGLYAGCKIVMTTKLPMNKIILKLMEDKEISIFFAVPTLLKGIMEYPKLRQYNLSKLRIINFYGASMYYKDILRLVDLFPQTNIFYSYGQTEASPRVTYIDKSHLLVKNKSCGKAIKNVKVHIIDEQGNEVNSNTIGEIVVTGKNVMIGYYKKPEKTAQTVIDGMLHTGDWGYMDEDGYLFITGRKDNMFISCGKNIYPEEIEGVLTTHKDILEALCYEKKKSDETSDIFARVVLKENASFDYNDVIEYCKKNLEIYKIPREIEVVNELEKTPSGKIKRNIVVK